ncbi:unnamed protein product [Dibothriocephalus latus]|uniref:Uncharacterized protein n=1 Tax=Dibothriocephalus latus TaxID=60516 RepID=A0A3P7KXI6_DIBLA|nr:unnamed protein product [Dibothriocephalus latus]
MYADDLLEELRYALSKIGVTVQSVFSDIRIISGDWEGRYAWISVNYLAKRLRDKTDQTPTPVLETVGALDLGGASTQISFALKPGTVDANLSEYKSQVSSLQLFGETYHLYSSSFLCYGSEASRMRYLATLIENVTDPQSEIISSPCHLRGYEFNLTTEKLFLHSCVDSQLAMITFKRSIKKPKGLPKRLKVIGSGDPEECRRLVSSLFDFTTCEYSSCSFNGVYQPPIRGNFYAFAAFQHQMSFIEFQFPGINLTRSQTQKAVDEYCRMNWQEVRLP